MNRTSLRIYTGLIGRRKGTVKISRCDECETLKCEPPPDGGAHRTPKARHALSTSETVQSDEGLAGILSRMSLNPAVLRPFRAAWHVRLDGSPYRLNNPSGAAVRRHSGIAGNFPLRQRAKRARP
jgi:hypothetical protein